MPIRREEEESRQSLSEGGPREFPSPPTIPGYVVLRRIGSGSYGDVWLGRDDAGRLCAIKIIYRDFFDNQKPFERELSGIRQYEPISRTHEGFIQIWQVGLDEKAGYFYYVMELGDDQVHGRRIDPGSYQAKTLGTEIERSGSLPVAQCLELGLALTRSLEELHRRGLAHRDVKPSNVIYFGGTPKLADVGMVAGIGDARSFVGTAGFIPPEGPGTPQADVFSLGRTLYEACTGRDRNFFPRFPSSIGEREKPESFMELNAVLLRACENDPKRRYKSAEAMRSDLMALAQGKSVRRLRRIEERAAWTKRVVAGAVVAAVLGTWLAWPFYQAKREGDEARQREIGAAIAYGNQALEAGDLTGALPYYANALAMHKGAQQENNDRLRIGMILQQSPKLISVWHLPSVVRHGEFNPNGQEIVLTEESGEIMFSPADGSGLRKIQKADYGRMAAFSHDGKYVALGESGQTTPVLDLKTLKPVIDLPQTETESVDFSPDDKHLVTAGGDGKLSVFEVKTARLQFAVKFEGSLRCVAFSHDGKLIATGGTDDTARILDADTVRVLRTLKHKSWVYSLGFSPDDKRLVTGCGDHFAWVWKVEDGSTISPAMPHPDHVYSVEYSPDGRTILTGCLDGAARFWSSDTQQPVKRNATLRMGERILSAAFAPDARRVLLTGAAGVAELWDLGGVTPPSDGRLCVASDDGTRFIVQSNGLNIVEDTATGASIGQGIFGDTPVQNILLSAHGHYAAAVSENSSEVKVIEIAAGKQTGPFQFSGPRQFVVSDDGAYLAATSAGFVEVISATNGKRLFSEQQDYGETNQVRFADDGVWMVVWGGHMIEELNPANGALRFPRLQFPQFVREANINSDETMLIGCASDDQFTACYAQVYDFKTGKALTPKLRQSDGILCCAFSHDNTKVATGGEDFTAYLWNMDGKRIGHPIRHEEQVSGISLNADASMLLTASRDKTARLWDGETGDPLSPPLRCDRIVLKAHFVSKDQILTLSTGNIGRLWPLETDTRPPQDIVDEASLLAGGVLDSEPTNKAAWLAETFERLRKKYPARFHASLPEAIRWHQEVVRESVAKGDVATAEFHRKQIALLENDKALETGGTARNAQ